MNTNELAELDHWDEDELAQLVTSFVRRFHRLPSRRELIVFRRCRAGLHLRLPARAQRPSTALLVGTA
jgi:hypothetical protein